MSDATPDDVVTTGSDVEEDGEFGGFEMADVPATAEAQPLPLTLQIVQNSWLLNMTGLQQSDVSQAVDNACQPKNRDEAVDGAKESMQTNTTSLPTTDFPLTQPTSSLPSSDWPCDSAIYKIDAVLTESVSNGALASLSQEFPSGATDLSTMPPLQALPIDGTGNIGEGTVMLTTAASSFSSGSYADAQPSSATISVTGVSPVSVPVAVMPVSAPSDVLALDLCRRQLSDEMQKYAMLQEQHRAEMCAMRQSTQDALSVIVQQYKELSSAAVQDCELTYKRQLKEFIDGERKTLADLLKAQDEKMKQTLEEERQKLASQLEDSLEQQRIKQQELYEAFLVEEKQQLQQKISNSLHEQQDISKKAIEEVVQLERERTRQALRDQQESMQHLISEEQERSQKTIAKAREQERLLAKQATDALVAQQMANIESVMDDTLKLTRQQIRLYIDEQRQADHCVRSRLMSSVDLLLDTARQQLQQLVLPPGELRPQLLGEAPPGNGEMQQLATDTSQSGSSDCCDLSALTHS